MEIEISLLHESAFSYEDVVNLMHESFEERLHQGLHFTCSSMTVSQYKERTKKGIVLIARKENKLVGTVTLSLCKDSNNIIYGYHEYLAVHPSAKYLGIGTKLQKECVRLIVQAGGQYEISDTAVGANSSVKWHLKNGFRKVALRSYPSTNYYSYVFRKQLIPSWKWNSNLYCSTTLFISSMVVKAVYKEDGSYTIIGKLVMKIMKR